MGDNSYAVFQRNMEYPSLDALEKFCFDARTKGASGKTKLEHGYRYDNFVVHIPEEQATTAYAAKPTPVPAGKRGIPTWVWLTVLILAIVIGLFV